ncbi:MAG TPA: hypothetical protein VMW63_01790 [Methanoregulaceae archaeon]|nr:hypothetical protein [Methanoregulaceae archaeon]
MKTRYLIALIIVLCMVSVPSQAMTAEYLEIRVDDEGEAQITFDYSLSLFENIAVFLRIADPAKELKSALESNSGKSVRVISISNGRVVMAVDDFAHVRHTGGRTIIRTPGMSFKEAEQILKGYWFAPLISIDFSPSVTRIVFPDGYTQVYYDQIEIAPITHEFLG